MSRPQIKTVTLEYWDCGEPEHSHTGELAAQKCMMKRKAREAREAKYAVLRESREQERMRQEETKKAVSEMLDEGMTVRQIAERLQITPQKAGRLRKNTLEDLAWAHRAHYPLNLNLEHRHWKLLECTEIEWQTNKAIIDKDIAALKKKHDQEMEREAKKRAKMQEARMREQKRAQVREELWRRAFLMRMDGIPVARIAEIIGLSEATAREYVRRGRIVIVHRRLSQHHRGWLTDKLPLKDRQKLATMSESEWQRRRWEIAASDFKSI
jgi:DNA-binding CsgD family transcriptional regulator